MSNEGQIQSHVANVIKEWRKTRGMSQAALADKVGMHQTAIAKIENNERRVDFATVAQIADVLDIPWQELHFEKPNKLVELREGVDAYLRSSYVMSRAIWNSYSTLAEVNEQVPKTLELFTDEETFNSNIFTLEELEDVMKSIADIPHDALTVLPPGDKVAAFLTQHKEKYDKIKTFRDKLNQVIHDASS